MSFAYIKNIVNEDWCLGNSLSTINIAFTSLDLALSALSAYTVRSVSFLSATMISVSSNLYTFINTASSVLQTEVNYLSSSINNLQNVYVNASGDTMTGNLNMSGNNITGINILSANTIYSGVSSYTGNLTVSGNIMFSKSIIPAGTTGTQTINKITGSVNFAASATSLLVNNYYVSLSSIILANVATNDPTMKSVQPVPANGSFTLYPDLAPTSETRVVFLITN